MDERKLSQREVDKLYDRYHKGKWEMQAEGPYGPGSCHCCPNGGPFAGVVAPKKVRA